MFTDTELRANLQACAKQIYVRDFPDAVQWKDLLFADTSVFAIIQQRLAEGFHPVRVHPIKLPKADGTDLRTLSVLDPFDELIFRTLVEQ